VGSRREVDGERHGAADRGAVVLEAAVEPPEHLVAAHLLRSGHLVPLNQSGAAPGEDCEGGESGAKGA
jgi:hypothetical protein